MSQSSQSSSNGSTSSSDNDDNGRGILEAYMEEALEKHSAAIKEMNKRKDKIFKERDRVTAEIEAKSEALYQKMLADHREYCKNNSGSVLDPIADILARLEKLRTEGLPELERCSEAIDPDNAEEVAKEIREKLSFRKKWRDQWRKRVIRENHEAIQQKKAEIRAKTDVKGKKIADMISAFMEDED